MWSILFVIYIPYIARCLFLFNLLSFFLYNQFLARGISTQQTLQLPVCTTKDEYAVPDYGRTVSVVCQEVWW
jgi:hypothetical protein